MRYRIKIINYRNNTKSYIPQVKYSVFWHGIDCQGDNLMFVGFETDSHTEAVNRIQKHLDGNKEVQYIEFEYLDNFDKETK